MKIFTSLKLTVLTIGIFSSFCSSAQPFSNDWLTGKFNQKFAKINVAATGLQRISFAQLQASGITVTESNKNLLNLYHRGELVKIVRVNASDIEFYGETNDGSRDSLLFRPTTARMNKYYSMYSDKGAYFITLGRSEQKAVVIPESSLSGTAETYHLQTDVNLQNTSLVDYTHGPWALYPPFPNESFHKEGETMSGPMILGTTKSTKTFSLTNALWDNSLPLPKLNIMVNGRQSGPQRIEVLLGTSITPSYIFSFSGFAGAKTQIEIPQSNITNGSGSFSVNGTIGASDYNRFSLTYYTVTYPQTIDMGGKSSYLFTLPSTSNESSRVKILNVPNNVTLLDISDKHSPKLINSSRLSDNSVEVMIPRESGRELKLFATDNSLTSSTLAGINVTELDPSNYDYLIITSKALIPNATAYSSYRNSAAGGSYKSLVVDIEDIYNQFNYGEPSPLAIRQFVDFMLSKGISDKHHLFLIGRSVSATRYLTKELPGYVPTIGYPGSDILLTSGLHGVNPDIPSIPVGRLATSTGSDIDNYLEKVRLYESKSNKELWRKQVLHINGGHSDYQIQRFQTILQKLESYVEDQNSFKGKEVIPYVKTGYQEPTETVSANISADLNAGVGMMTYFGHGSPNDTDYNIKRFGAESAYNNNGQYPFMYFNGCGVSNIFANYGNATTNAREDALANTWVLAKGKGAIANIGGTLLSYVEPTEKYLSYFYDEIFNSPDPTNARAAASSERQTIGRIMKIVAERTIQGSHDNMDITNIHQSLLLGDPAIVILEVDQTSLPVNLTSFTGKSISPNEVLLNWTTDAETNNNHFVVEKSNDATTFEKIGVVDGKGTSTDKNAYSLTDIHAYSGMNYYRLVQVDNDGTKTVSRIISVKNNFVDNVVYPNPIIDNALYIKTQNNSKPVRWKVFTIEGKLLKNITTSQTKISLNDLSEGKYVIEVTTSDNVVTKKTVYKK
jgi:hypothetical protein